MYRENSFPPVYLVVCSGCGCLGKIVSPRIPYCLFWMRVFRENSFPPVYLVVCYGCGCIGKNRFPPYTLVVPNFSFDLISEFRGKSDKWRLIVKETQQYLDRDFVAVAGAHARSQFKTSLMNRPDLQRITHDSHLFHTRGLLHLINSWSE